MIGKKAQGIKGLLPKHSVHLVGKKSGRVAPVPG